MLVTQAMKKWSYFMSLCVTVGGSCATERNKHKARKWQSEQVTYKMASDTCYLNSCVNKWKLSGRDMRSSLRWFSHEGGTSLTCPPCHTCGKYTANIHSLILNCPLYACRLNENNERRVNSFISIIRACSWVYGDASRRRGINWPLFYVLYCEMCAIAKGVSCV